MITCIFCGKECKNKNSQSNHQLRCEKNENRRWWTTKGNRVSAWNKGLTKEDPRVKKYAEATSATLKCRPSRPHSDETKAVLSEHAKRRGLGGITQSRWIEYNGKRLGSSYELELAKSLDESGINWDTCTKIKYTDPNGKSRTYTPDVYLVDYDVYLDPKNDFLINNVNPAMGFTDSEKIKLVCEQNNITVHILNKSQLSWDYVKTLL